MRDGFPPTSPERFRADSGVTLSLSPLMWNAAPVLHDWSIEERGYLRQEERRGRRHAFLGLDAQRTALVVVDLVAFFMDENDYTRGIVPNVNRLATTLRRAGGTIAWVVPAPWDPSAMKDELLGSRIADLYRHSGGTGTPKERVWHELATDDADLFVEKTASSAFFPGRCPLHELLTSRSIDTVMVTGTLATSAARRPLVMRALSTTARSWSPMPTPPAATKTSTPPSTRSIGRSATFGPPTTYWR